MKIENEHYAIANEDFYQNAFVFIKEGHAVRATLPCSKKELYRVICNVKKGEMAMLANEDTIFHIQED